MTCHHLDLWYSLSTSIQPHLHTHPHHPPFKMWWTLWVLPLLVSMTIVYSKLLGTAYNPLAAIYIYIYIYTCVCLSVCLQVNVSPVTALKLLLELPPNITVNNTQRLSLLRRAFTTAQNMTVTTEFVEVLHFVNDYSCNQCEVHETESVELLYNNSVFVMNGLMKSDYNSAFWGLVIYY